MEEKTIQEDPWAFQQIETLLKQQTIEYKTLDHEPVRTSEEAAKVRGATLASGAKAMLLKDGKNNIFLLTVMSASRKLSWKLIKKALNLKKIEMAGETDVKEITRCLPGAVPPFGSIFKVKTYLDQSLINQGTETNFNCGLRTKSMRIKVEDYIKVEKPEILEFTDEI